MKVSQQRLHTSTRGKPANLTVARFKIRLWPVLLSLALLTVRRHPPEHKRRIRPITLSFINRVYRPAFLWSLRDGVEVYKSFCVCVGLFPLTKFRRMATV